MNSFKDKCVLIFGLGLNQGGVGSAKFFARQGAKVRVTDLKSESILQSSIDQLKYFPEIEYTFGQHKKEDIDWADFIIKNPSVKPDNQYMDYAKSKGKEIETDIGILLQFIKSSQIIGVTGTKGKSTTSSLIYEILKGKKNILFAGNIGKSVLDIIPLVNSKTLIILEISSFQLDAFEQKKVSPKFAVITNIYPDHLNYYKTMEEYILAKKIIGKYQAKDDFLFIRKDDPIVDQPNFLEGLKGDIIRFSKNDLPARDASQSVAGGPKNFNPTLKGEHNIENITAAIKVGEQFGLDKNQMLKAISEFKGVPFRMELIGDWNGVKIINDTTATGPDAGIKALETASHMTSGNVILICGGMNKGMDYTQYVAAVTKCAREIFLLEGDSTDIILKSLQESQNNLKINGPYSDLEKLLIDVRSVAQKGDTILFSPAATSFNLFQNEFDRGRRFNDAVEKIFI